MERKPIRAKDLLAVRKQAEQPYSVPEAIQQEVNYRDLAEQIHKAMRQITNTQLPNAGWAAKALQSAYDWLLIIDRAVERGIVK